jgi:3'-5' exoribonuclease
MMIKDFVTGERITTHLLLKEIELKTWDNGTRLSLVLGDRSGDIDAVVWNDAEALKAELEGIEVVKVQGTVGSYRNKPQLKVEKIRPAREGEYNSADLKRAALKPPAELRADFMALVDSIQNPYLASLLKLVAEDEEIFSKYLSRPAGKKFHHDFIAGLADHSLSLARLADLVCCNYPGLDRDLLVTGALLHDLGKIFEFEGDLVFDYSDPGRLIGHITMGDHIVADMIGRIEDFPQTLGLKLRHLILSHHGELDKGAVVKPKIREAFVLNYLDEIDSKLDAINKIAEKADGKWSEYIKPLEDFLFFG